MFLDKQQSYKQTVEYLYDVTDYVTIFITTQHNPYLVHIGVTEGYIQVPAAGGMTNYSATTKSRYNATHVIHITQSIRPMARPPGRDMRRPL